MDTLQFENRSLRMTGPLDKKNMMLLRAEVREGISQITEIDVEFLSNEIDLKFDDIIGEAIGIEMDTEGENVRHFWGHCVDVVFEGIYQGLGHYVASLRSWPWFLTQTADCRIFQDKTALEIAKDIFNEHGFSNVQDKTTTTPQARVYCVQYRETDYDFIYRLFAEEGINFFMEYESGKDTLVLTDDPLRHENIAERATLDFFFKEDGYRRREDHVFDWRDRETLRTATVTLNDYDFTKPSSDLVSSRTTRKSYAKNNAYEVYDYPGRFSDTGRGEALARVRAEAFSSECHRSRGVANVRTMACGHRFTMTNHPRSGSNREYLVVEAIHQMQIETDFDFGELGETVLGERVTLDPDQNPDPYRVTFRAQPHDAALRPPYPVRRPLIAGLQTAKVVGPKGKEIHTDEYGRVKVQFHWDREGGNNELSSCWIRKAEPWSGKNWGMVWVPRIGQEVVVQFEEGDPDRPLIVGMLFNEETKHPYSLPANMTMMGWTTRSTMKGSADTHHELVFEDKKDAEYVRFQSERDYMQYIKNNAEIEIGLDYQDPGDLTQTIQNHKTETLKQGDHTFTVETGSETYHIETDRAVTVNNDHTETVANDQTVSIGNNRTVDVGNDHTETIANNQTVDIGSNHSETIGGNQTVDVGSALSITAKSKITLKCGGSKIEITPSKISISSTMVEVKASANAKVQGGAMLDLKGSAMIKAQGGIIKLN